MIRLTINPQPVRGAGDHDTVSDLDLTVGVTRADNDGIFEWLTELVERVKSDGFLPEFQKPECKHTAGKFRAHFVHTDDKHHVMFACPDCGLELTGETGRGEQ